MVKCFSFSTSMLRWASLLLRRLSRVKCTLLQRKALILESSLQTLSSSTPIASAELWGAAYAAEGCAMTSAGDKKMFNRALYEAMNDGRNSIDSDWRKNLKVGGCLVTDAKSLHDHVHNLDAPTASFGNRRWKRQRGFAICIPVPQHVPFCKKSPCACVSWLCMAAMTNVLTCFNTCCCIWLSFSTFSAAPYPGKKIITTCYCEEAVL